MSDTRSIDVTITLKNPDGTPVPPAPVPKPEPEPTPNQPEPPAQTSRSGMSIVSAVIANQAWNQAKSLLMNEINYEVNKAFNLRDDYIGQRQLSVAKSLVSKVGSIGLSIAGGFAVGGVAGAVVAGVGSILSTGVQIYQNMDQQNIDLRKQEAQLDFTRQRAGFSLTSNSIGDNL